MRVETSLPPKDAFVAMLGALTSEGVQVTRAVPPLLQGETVTTRGGNIRTHTLSVTVGPSPSGSVVTINGQDDAYRAGRRAARSLPH